MIFLGLAIIGCAHTNETKIIPTERTKSYHKLSSATATQYFVYAAMSSSAYVGEDHHFDLAKIGWRKIDMNGLPMADSTRQSYVARKFLVFGSGLAFDIWEKTGSSEVVFAFRGTDSMGAWIKADLAMPFSVPYKSAKKKLRTAKPRKETSIVDVMTGAVQEAGELRARLAGHNTFED